MTLSTAARANTPELTSAAASRLSTGDFVFFRASGDKEFVRLIAEESLGAAGISAHPRQSPNAGRRHFTALAVVLPRFNDGWRIMALSGHPQLLPDGSATRTA